MWGRSKVLLLLLCRAVIRFIGARKLLIEIEFLISEFGCVRYNLLLPGGPLSWGPPLVVVKTGRFVKRRRKTAWVDSTLWRVMSNECMIEAVPGSLMFEIGECVSQTT